MVAWVQGSLEPTHQAWRWGTRDCSASVALSFAQTGPGAAGCCSLAELGQAGGTGAIATTSSPGQGKCTARAVASPRLNNRQGQKRDGVGMVLQHYGG